MSYLFLSCTEILKIMVQSSTFLPLGHDSLNEQDVIAMKSPVRSVCRKATITKEELFQATLNLIGPQKSIASLSLREVAREAGIAPNSFYRHFKDIDELAIGLPIVTVKQIGRAHV